MPEIVLQVENLYEAYELYEAPRRRRAFSVSPLHLEPQEAGRRSRGLRPSRAEKSPPGWGTLESRLHRKSFVGALTGLAGSHFVFFRNGLQSL